MPVEFILNGAITKVDVSPDTPLLWVLRDTLGLTGTKYGCGIGACGACKVHVDGQAVPSCVMPAVAAAGKLVTTIERLGSSSLGRRVQSAWLEEDVSQCGYCQPGQLMSAAALLARLPRPTDQEIDSAMAGNICRCGTYHRIRRAVRRAAESSTP